MHLLNRLQECVYSVSSSLRSRWRLRRGALKNVDEPAILQENGEIAVRDLAG
jgi:hypothetical protein